jgi:TPR repeat protein
LAYHTGCGVGIDYERAAAWYRRAACGADDCAMANLGVMALLGQPGPADEQEAYCWIRSAVAMGHARLRPALDWLERRIVRGVGEESLRPSISLEIPASRPCTQSACVHSLCNVA